MQAEPFFSGAWWGRSEEYDNINKYGGYRRKATSDRVTIGDKSSGSRMCQRLIRSTDLTRNKPSVEVCFTPNLYDLHSDDEHIVVAIDVLRATSAICAAFENGVEKIIPVSTLEEARQYKKKGYIVAAERKGEPVEGFDLGNSPHAYANNKYEGETIVLTTTNGTVAINTAKNSPVVVIGSLLNLDALCEWLVEQNKNVLLLGSGWKDKFSLEDTVCAGAITDHLLNTGKFRSEEDASVAARYLFLSAKDNVFSYLRASSHRKRTRKLDLKDDVRYCLTPNQTSVIPILKRGAIVKLDSNR